MVSSPSVVSGSAFVSSPTVVPSRVVVPSPVVEEMEWELGMQEVEMDVDLTEEEQAVVMAELQRVRGEIKPGSTPDDLGLPQDPGNYSVSCVIG